MGFEWTTLPPFKKILIQDFVQLLALDRKSKLDSLGQILFFVKESTDRHIRTQNQMTTLVFCVLRID